ncbi:STAS-like domain-containing protein [Desulfomonile tiedjei]|uniref:STAS-like domain-containing protein n=1 Tax=Desulfomonile tiedjei TaxID=2358 RepID=UPI001B7FB278|nr:STAS-like domain-containing protein [Desulfomonile tiedjei]
MRDHPSDIANFTAEQFGISRQAINKHLQHLVSADLLSAQGSTRDRHYVLKPVVEKEFTYSLDGTLKEDVVWRNDIAPLFADLPRNVQEIWQYGITEMLNNAIEHSSGTFARLYVFRSAIDARIGLLDNGEGIFKKIQREMNLDDERHAVLELAKGKLTTDPKRHTGEGIFFSSRMFDWFNIRSDQTEFDHSLNGLDWIMEIPQLPKGTVVVMKLSNSTKRTAKEVFDNFTSGEDYGFTKTIVPVKLAKYGEEMLISRSQAKRLLARIEKFKIAVFDFQEVESIGQAFADEIFRVFSEEYPDITILHMNANEYVKRMIERARGPH